MNEQLTVFGGLRYTDETKKQQTHPSFCETFLTCVILGNPALTETTDAPVDIELEHWTWTAGLRYQIREDIMLYGSVGTGVKSGAFNNTANPEGDFAANNLVTDEEEVISYEVGMKSSWMANRLNVNLAVFYMDYDDLQVRLGCASCGAGGIPLRFLSNAGTATSEGFELELVAAPTDSLRFTAGIGYMDASYDELKDVEDPRTGEFSDVGGNVIALAPDWTLNASAVHTAELMGGTLTSRLNLSYVGERYADSSFHNHPDDLMPDQTLLDARVGYRPAADNWGVTLWVKNLTDDDSEVYNAYGDTFLPFGTNRAQFQEPRTYGVALDYAF
jgi:iron complex outermembrane receptor protein